MPTGLEYLPRHWRVVPVRGKIPLGHNWPAKALTVADAESVRPPKNAEGWGLVLGPSSGVIDLETDGPEGEATYSKLVQGNPPICPCWKSPRGKHRLFQWHPMLENLPAAIHLGPGLELRVGHDKAHSTLPPVQGRHWLVIPLDVDPPPLPEPILALALSKLAPAHRPYTAPIPEIPQGARNTTLTSVAGFLRRKGATLEIILQALRELNHIWCSPPLPDKEIQAIAKSISKYPANEYPPPALPDSSQCPAPAIGHLLDKEAKLASVLNQLWHNLYRWDSYQKSWRKFIGTHWQLISQERVVAEAQATLCTHFHAELQIAQAANAPEEDIDQIRRWLSQSQSVLMVQRALQLLCGMDGFFTSPEQWDANPALLNTLSGTYNLMDNELLPHSPEMLLTKLAPTHIGDPEGGIRWLQHLEMCLPNPDIRAQLQYDLGAALYGAHIRDIFCVWYGVGANGKTTTMRVIQAVLGLNLAGSFTGYCAQIPASILLRAQFPQHPTGLMTLNKVRLAFATEPPQDCRLDEAAVKLLSGGDPITARLVFRDFTTFLPSHTIILITNHKPELSCDEALWRRVHFIPWEGVIPPEARLPEQEILQQLLAESASILGWMLQGWRRYQEDPHWKSQSIQMATKKLRDEVDQIAAFLNANCCKAPGHSVPARALRERYEQWCDDQGLSPVSKQLFTRLLQQAGLQATGYRGNRRMWLDIMLLPREDDIPLAPPREEDFDDQDIQ